jgi:hypothetical protein
MEWKRNEVISSMEWKSIKTQTSCCSLFRDRSEFSEDLILTMSLASANQWQIKLQGTKKKRKKPL